MIQKKNKQELQDDHSFMILDGVFLTSLGYNMASFHSIYHGGVAFTATDPLLGSIFVSLLWLFLRFSQYYPKIHGPICVLGIIILSFGGVRTHIVNRKLYENAAAYHDTHWHGAVILNAISVLVLMTRALHKKARSPACIVLVLLVSIGMIAKSFKTNQFQDMCADVPFFESIGFGLPALPVNRTSQYVTMTDGVELAVDTYLPRDHENKPLPTFLHLTRYHRAEQRSAFTQFIHLFGAPPTPDGHFPMRSLHYINAFVPDGYAFVSVDVRGTGASFGSRPVDLVDREVQDYKELAKWVKEQPFCNGRVGTGGISYDGIAGALMASHGNIDAVALLFSPGDIFEDIGFVGGIPTIGFIDLYGKFTTASENNLPVDDVDNELPSSFKFISKHALNGVAPVIGQEHRLQDAVAEHANNFDMLKAARDPDIIAKDSIVNTGVDQGDGHSGYSLESLGIGHKTFKGLEAHNVAVYSIAGYYDSASLRSSARLHNHLTRFGKSGQSKLTVGPWTHGARACWTPQGEGTLPQYPLFEDVKRFFDCKLKDECGVLEKEPHLHYFNSGKDEWNVGSEDSLWPPKGLKMKSLSLEKGTVTGYDTLDPLTFNVIHNATSGLVSRWNLVFHLMKMSVTYPHLASQQDTSLVFSWILSTHPLCLVGSVQVELSMALLHREGQDIEDDKQKDAALFAYLEELDPASGTIKYITEGVIRASHRVTQSLEKEQEEVRIGAMDNIQRSFKSTDMQPFKVGEKALVQFSLEPIAYTVPKDRVLRLRLAGADTHNFYLDNIKGLAQRWEIDAGNSLIHIPSDGECEV